MNARVPRAPLQSSRTHPVLQGPMSKDCWMAIWAKWSPFNPPTKASSELKYQCGQKWCKQCCPPHRPSARLHPGELPFKLGQNRAVGLTPQTQEGTPFEPASAKRAEEEAEEEDEETYVVPEGQGCFSFRQSLLLRAKDTFAARCTGNKYEVISRWLLTGLAVVLSRQNWQLLAKRGTLTATPQNLLKRYHAT